MARIISESHRAAQALAMDLLARGYAVEIVSPDAHPTTPADLEVRVGLDFPHPLDQQPQPDPIAFDAEQEPTDVELPAGEYWWPSETKDSAAMGAAEMEGSARLLSAQAVQEIADNDVEACGSGNERADRSGVWFLRVSTAFAALAVLALFGLALLTNRASSHRQNSTLENAKTFVTAARGKSSPTANDSGALSGVSENLIKAPQRKTNVAFSRRLATADKEIIAPDTVTYFDRRQETKAAPPTQPPAIKHYSDLN